MSNLKRRAKKNVSVTHKNSDGKIETIKNGSVADVSEKTRGAKTSGEKIVGLSVGLTKNMDNFESLRVDVWLTEVYDSEEERDSKFEELRETLGEVLEETVREYI